MFSRVLKYYSFGDVEKVRGLPLTTFWMLHKNIDRIEAEGDMRSAELMVRTQSPEGLEGLFEELRDRLGKVVEMEQLAEGVTVTDAKRRYDDTRSNPDTLKAFAASLSLGV